MRRQREIFAAAVGNENEWKQIYRVSYPPAYYSHLTTISGIEILNYIEIKFLGS